MKQQFAFNVQQHQDNPGQKKPKYGEYIDPANPAWQGTINPAVTQAAFTANRATFTNNRFIRRYYLRDGDDGRITGDMGPVPGVSAWFPDMSNAVPATGNLINRRFYIPSVGVGASGSYFNNHFFTLVGYRQDHFNMRTTVGLVQPIKDKWVNELVPGAFAPTPNPAFVNYSVDGSNYGVVFRVNDTLAFALNRAQSFRISAGEGADLFTPGKKQEIQTGKGQDASIRLSLSAAAWKSTAPTTTISNPTPASRLRRPSRSATKSRRYFRRRSIRSARTTSTSRPAATNSSSSPTSHASGASSSTARPTSSSPKNACRCSTAFRPRPRH
jgi:hypothetical protein